MNLNFFLEQPFLPALQSFFDGLNIPINPIASTPIAPGELLGAHYKGDSDAHALIDEIYALGLVDDAAFEAGSTPTALDAVQSAGSDYDGLLIFGVSLKARANNINPSRGQMAEITRAFNRAYHFTPVVVVFRYENCIAFAACERSAYSQQWREGEKAGKVSILRDIDLQKTHAGHERILQELKINPLEINSFAKLYEYWRKKLSVQTLNKEFYGALSNWFFAAKEYSHFPDKGDHAEERGLIRLITRLIFTWFIKERGLVPGVLFDPKTIPTLLKDSAPDSDSYYRAILQNLFFATLNTEMNQRRFCKDSGGAHGQKGDYAVTCFRYQDEFASPENWLELVKDVPFLNGGLFEC